MKNYRLALLPGDGIGKEVIPAAVQVLGAAAQEFTLPSNRSIGVANTTCARAG
jgi:isocitrate/isopropylmalate dehydrogenase